MPVNRLNIAVASGKGGTGKTMVATSLAMALEGDLPVQLLDCDVEAPNAHLFLGPELDFHEAVTIPVPQVDKDRCTACGRCAEVCFFNALAVVGGGVITFPELCHGCGACAMLCPAGAITEVGRSIGTVEAGMAGGIAFGHGRLDIGQPLAPPIIRRVKRLARGAGVVIIDAPPGAACAMVEAVRDSDYCLLVTEPTPFGLHDLKLAVATVRRLGLPAGVVLNRLGSGGEAATEAYCREAALPILLRIPLDMGIAADYARGIPLVTARPEYRDGLRALYHQIAAEVGR